LPTVLGLVVVELLGKDEPTLKPQPPGCVAIATGNVESAKKLQALIVEYGRK